MNKKQIVHEGHDHDERYTACGLKWRDLPDEASEGKVTCKRCIKNLKALWNNRGV